MGGKAQKVPGPGLQTPFTSKKNWCSLEKEPILGLEQRKYYISLEDLVPEGKK